MPMVFGTLRISVPTEKHGVVIKPVLITLTRRFLPIPSGLSWSIYSIMLLNRTWETAVEPLVIRRAVIPTTALPQSL